MNDKYQLRYPSGSPTDVKKTLTSCVDPVRHHKVQELVRRWYYVEGETGVGHHKSQTFGIYTTVSQAVDNLKLARLLMDDWIKSRRGLFHARVVRIVESKRVIVTKAPNERANC